MSVAARKPLLVVGGAINTDLVATMTRAPEAGETITAETYASYGGGKGANQAIAARRAGARVAMIGAVGDDAFGRARRAGLDRDGVDTSHIATHPSYGSGVALIFVEASGDNRIAYVPGATLSVQPDECRAAIVALRPSHVLAPNEFAPNALEALFFAAREIGAHVTMNAAPDPERIQRFLPCIDLLVANEGEAAAILGNQRESVDPAVQAANLMDQGPGAAIVTAGERGAFGATRAETFAHSPSQDVEVVDTTGAGDTFCGSLVAALMEGMSLDRACRFGVVASALSVKRRGAQSSIPRRDEILRAIASIGGGEAT